MSTSVSHYSNDSRNLSNWHELVDLVQMWVPICFAYDCTTNKATRSPKISGQQVQKLIPQLFLNVGNSIKREMK